MSVDYDLILKNQNELYSQMSELMQEKSWDLISDKLAKYIDVLTEEKEVLKRLSSCNLDESECEELENLYMGLTNKYVDVYSIKSIIAINQNQLNEAEQFLKDGLILDENSFDLNYNLGYVYGLKENEQKMVQHYKRAYELCRNEVLENEIRAVLEAKDIKIDLKKIAFFVKEGMDSFLGDVIDGLSDEYETRKIVVTKSEDIQTGMDWADICWFEWCDELIAYGSKLEIAKSKKIICRIHGYEVYTDLIMKPDWNNVDRLVIVAPHIKRLFEKNTNHIRKENLIVDMVYCGIDMDKYPLNVREKGFNIGYLGYINYKKNIPLTLEIFKMLYERDDRYKLYIAGEYQDLRTLEYVKYFIAEYGFEKCIFYDGWKNSEEKVEWLKKIDYMLISSIDEGLCYAAAESMCCGIKPVLHNCEGLRDHYDEKYIFHSVYEAQKMIESEEYDSKEYRNFIEEKYSLEKQMESLRIILNELTHIKKLELCF